MKGSRDSYVFVPENVVFDKRLSHAGFRIYSYIRSFADPNGMCNVRQTTVATALHVSQATVCRHVQELERLGHIKVEHLGTGSNLIRIVGMSGIGVVG